MTTTTPQTFIFVGSQGSGKGTQLDLLKQYLAKEQADIPHWHVDTGAAFREIKKQDSHTNRLMQKLLDSGGLLPVFMPIRIWGQAFMENYTGAEHVFIDGFPRRLLEAEALDSAFKFYDQNDVQVVYLNVPEEENIARLMKRATEQGRADDSEEGIRTRLNAYYEQTMPVLDYFRSTNGYTVHDINGVGELDAIHQDILNKLGFK